MAVRAEPQQSGADAGSRRNRNRRGHCYAGPSRAGAWAIDRSAGGLPCRRGCVEDCRFAAQPTLGGLWVALAQRGFVPAARPSDLAAVAAGRHLRTRYPDWREFAVHRRCPARLGAIDARNHAQSDLRGAGRTGLKRLLRAGAERIAAANLPRPQPGQQPARALFGGSMREGIGHDVALAPPLQPVIANRRGRLDGRLDVTGFDDPPPFRRIVAPHAGAAIRLQFNGNLQLVALDLIQTKLPLLYLR